MPDFSLFNKKESAYSLLADQNMKNKKIESHHFKQFRRGLGNFPNGEVCHLDKPDFLVYSEGGIIGIEHCRIHKPSQIGRTPLQAIESQTDEIVAIAQEQAELRGTPEVHATFLFSMHKPMQKKQRVELGRKVAQLIHRKLEEMDNLEPFQRIEIRYPDVPDEINSIHFITVKNDMNQFWRCARAGFGMSDCKVTIQEAINPKAEKFPEYIKRCDQCWLLLVAEGNPSSFIHPNEESLNHTYNSPFAKTYFFDMAQGKIYLLRTK